jgi:hypothetical protein
MHKDWHRKESQVYSLDRDVLLPHDSVECLQPGDEHSRVRDKSGLQKIAEHLRLVTCCCAFASWVIGLFLSRRI